MMLALRVVTVDQKSSTIGFPGCPVRRTVTRGCADAKARGQSQSAQMIEIVANKFVLCIPCSFFTQWKRLTRDQQ